MRNIARLSDNDRRELFRNTADKMGLNDAIVEKDFDGSLNIQERSTGFGSEDLPGGCQE